MARQLTAPKDPESLAGVLAIVRILAGERGFPHDGIPHPLLRMHNG